MAQHRGGLIVRTRWIFPCLALGVNPTGLAIKTKLLGVAVTVGLLSFSATSKANVVYDWQGTCTLGCTGTATGVLTLTDGASPFNFGLLNFISFSRRIKDSGRARPIAQ